MSHRTLLDRAGCFVLAVVTALGTADFAAAATETKPKPATTAAKTATKPKTAAAVPKAAVTPKPVPAAEAPVAATAGPATVAAPAAAAAAPADKKAGEMDVTITSTNKQKLVIGKLDPPAAFNLEDIQNFPEDRLQPLLNSPVTFNEGRDFSTLMDFKDDQPYHPWLPEISKGPFLEMKSPALDKASKEWNFAIIDQGGGTVYKLDGKGTPPAMLTWNGEDSKRVRVAVDTVYIPQLNTVDKEGYHRTFMGQPIQFSSIQYSETGKTTIELSSKRLFVERKASFTKEGPLMLDKVCDAIREGSYLPFAIQPYGTDEALSRERQTALAKYFKEKLFIPENQIVSSVPQDSEKRGDAMAIVSTSAPGGTGQ